MGYDSCSRAGMRWFLFVVALLTLGFSPTMGLAQTLLTDLSTFTGSETVIDFESLPAGPVTNPFVTQGATFATTTGTAVIVFIDDDDGDGFGRDAVILGYAFDDHEIRVRIHQVRYRWVGRHP